MVAVGRGSRSITYKLHKANLERIKLRRERVLIAIATAIAEDEEVSEVKPRKSPRIRNRARVSDLFDDLGGRGRRAYRMSFKAFCVLFRKIKNELDETFKPDGGHHSDAYKIRNSLRLSCALRFYAGASIYDLIHSHGISSSQIYDSAWGVADAINNCKDLDFPGFSHEEQKKNAEGFFNRSAAGFDKIIGAVDGMLVWTRMPTDEECAMARTGHGKFKCTRKGKYGLNMQAACDSERRFIWISIITPGTTSDYLSYITSDLIKTIKDPGVLLPGHVFVGDNAYVKSVEMATPIKNARPGVEDDYNYYCSQLCIIIECAFGILVQRWGILRRPLLCNFQRIPALITALCRLHNFCIDNRENVAPTRSSDIVAIRRCARKNANGADEVRLDENNRPVSLLNAADGIRSDTGSRPCRLEGDGFTMDAMLEKVKRLGLRRPKRNCRRA